jgi:DtxR family Mn-dependent transcriptional regulator
MKEQELIRIENEDLILLPEGRQRAEGIVRRHRLAERLLMDVLGVGFQHAHDSACKFEHILSPEVTESVCIFLGHPPLCPHSKPIPPGECCRKVSWKVEPVLQRLTDAMVGQKGEVVFIHTRHHHRLEHLSAFGIVPGSVVRLHQKSPSYVLEVGQTTLALDREIVDEIYVKKV